MRRRCKGCGRFVSKRNTTRYWHQPIIFPEWKGRERRSCNNCGRRGLWFWWHILDNLLKVTYGKVIPDLLNMETPLYDRFRRGTA